MKYFIFLDKYNIGFIIVGNCLFVLSFLSTFIFACKTLFQMGKVERSK